MTAAAAATTVDSHMLELYRSRGVILTQMEVQGYNVDKYTGFSVSEIEAMAGAMQLDMTLETAGDAAPKRKMYVYYHTHKKLQPNNLSDIVDELFYVTQTLDTRDTLYLVAKDDPNDTIRHMLNHLWKQRQLFVVVQSIKRLQYNILNHQLQPHFRVLSEEEAAAVARKYNIMDDRQWPDLSRFDPVAVTLCVRPGQVCEITRPSTTAISAPYWRMCSCPNE